MSNLTERNIEDLITAVSRITRGDDYPTGFEALVMSISGSATFGSTISDACLTDSLDGIAEAIRYLADTIEAKS